jgi:hypothetical protein
MNHAGEHQRIVLVDDSPAKKLTAGDLRKVVISVMTEPVFEVEFSTLTCEAVAIVALEKTQVRAVGHRVTRTPRWMANRCAQESCRYRLLNGGAESRL